MKKVTSGLVGKIQDNAAKVKRENQAPHLIVKAMAGTGKTTTIIEGLKLLKGITPSITPSLQQQTIWDAMLESKEARTVCFCAFNSSIAKELKSRVPPGCQAMTMHSMGLGAIREQYGRHVNLDKWRLNGIAGEAIIKQRKGDGEYIPNDEEAREDCLVVDLIIALVRLCKVNLVVLDMEDSQDKAACWRLLDELAGYYDIEVEEEHKDRVYNLVPRVLELCKDITNTVDFDDMIWVPVINRLPMKKYDLLLVDEAQDLNRCQQALARMAGERIIMVGDPHQCQPIGTMVSVVSKPSQGCAPTQTSLVSIEQIQVGDKLWGYSVKDCHFYASATVEAVASRPYSGTMISITTEEGDTSRYTPNHKCVASFAPLRGKHVVYLMRRDGQYRVGMSKIEQPGNQGSGPFMRMRNSGGDALWILEFNDTRAETLMREQAISGRFGLPQLMFDPDNVTDVDLVRKAWEFIGNNFIRARECLEYFGKDVRYPLISSDSGTMRGESSLPSMKRPMLVYASNLVTGCLVLPFHGKKQGKKSDWRSITVTHEKYRGPVYSLSVSNYQTYVADGIVTHNSVYGFAGADTESMPRMETELGGSFRKCNTLPLTVTRRCGKAIVEEARKIVPEFEAHGDNHNGYVRHTSCYIWERSGPTETESGCRNGDFVLCRTNVPLVQNAFRFIRAGRRVVIIGRDIGAGLINLLNKLLKPEQGSDEVSMTLLENRIIAWQTIETREENSKEHPNENKLIMIADKAACLLEFVRACQTPNEVRDRIISLFSDNGDKSSRVTFSSIHRAKGLEAKRVWFLMPHNGQCPHPMSTTPWQLEQESNLLYVGITRAIEELIFVRE